MEHKQPTYHLLQQLAVALPKQHTQIQNFGNVEKKVVIDDFSKHRRGDEVLLREEMHAHAATINTKRSSSKPLRRRSHDLTFDSLCVAILRKVRKTAL